MLEPLTSGRRRRTRGMTLLELSITMAIAVALGLVSVPSLSSWVAHHRVRSAAQDLVVDFGDARLESVRLARPVHVVFRPGTSWCYAVALEATADCTHPDDRVLKVARSAQYPGVAMVEAAPHVFDGRDGTLPGASGYSRFESAKGEQVQVRISGLGRPALCAPDGRARGVARC